MRKYRGPVWADPTKLPERPKEEVRKSKVVEQRRRAWAEFEKWRKEAPQQQA